MKIRAYWLLAILYLVLQFDFWSAPWHSRLQQAALAASAILTFAYVASLAFHYRTRIWRMIQRLRRD